MFGTNELPMSTLYHHPKDKMRRALLPLIEPRGFTPPGMLRIVATPLLV